MKHRYLVIIQFAKAGVKFDEQVQRAIDESVANYNARSLFARNPKQILEYEFSKNLSTMKVILQSDERLPVPARALRLFSVYLLNETFVGNGGYLTGKQLFKMSSTEINEDIKGESVEVEISGVDLLRKVNDKAAQLIIKGDLKKYLIFRGELEMSVDFTKMVKRQMLALGLL